MANIEGLRQTLEHIKEHPKEWDQGRWHMCFAGISLRVVRGAVLTDSVCCDICRDLAMGDEIVPPYGVSELAQEALELTEEQCRALFNGTNTLGDLTNMVAEISAAEPAAV